MIRAAVFDFDGVVLESVDVKTRAFARVVGDWPEHVDAMVDYHLAHGGVSRFEKFAWFHRERLGREITAAESAAMGERFSAMALDEVLACAFVPGARELLERRARELPLYVASGTPQDELREIVARRDLERLFTGVYGSPPTKAQILERVADEEGCTPSELLMVGDAMTDYEGARAVGAAFAGRVPPGDDDPFPPGTLAVEDLAALDAAWEELVARVPAAP